MATIYTRATKGSALTWTEGDANITNLNNDKIELTSLSVGTEGTASGDGAISYNNTTGVFTYTPPVIPSAGISDVVADTTPQLGGNLDVNGNSIVSTSNGNIVLEPNGTGDIFLNADRVRVGDSAAAAMLTSNQTGDLILTTNDGVSTSGVIRLFNGGAANANITITPHGTGQTLVKNLEYNENVFALGTTSGTITPDAANGNVQTITLNGNLTFNAFANPISGQTISLIITTGGTGRTLTSTMLFAGASKTLSTTSTVDILTVSYIGTTYYASLVKGYA